MLSSVRSRVSATGGVVVVGTLSRSNVSETRGRRVGGSDLSDSLRQIQATNNQSDQMNQGDNSVSQSSHELTNFDKFMNSNVFSKMVEDVARLDSVQEIIFSNIPMTMFEKDKNRLKGATATIEVDSDEEFDKLSWSLVADDMKDSSNMENEDEAENESENSEKDENNTTDATTPPATEANISRKEFENMKDEKDFQVSFLPPFCVLLKYLLRKQCAHVIMWIYIYTQF